VVRQRDGQAVHLFAALDHTSGIVLGQTEVDVKTNEITTFAPLLDRIDPNASWGGGGFSMDSELVQVVGGGVVAAGGAARERIE
jgi:hypothetical protein